MTEIYRNRPLEPKQELVDAYHPKFFVNQSSDVVVEPSEYLRAREKKDREILATDPNAILPHYPCG